MKSIVVSLLFCVINFNIRVQAGPQCMVGNKIEAPPYVNMQPTLETCDDGLSCAIITADLSITTEQASLETQIQTGHCYPTAACSSVSSACTALQSMESTFQAIGGVLQNCSAKCLPLSSTEKPDSVPSDRNSAPEGCYVPIWNDKLKDNWSGVTGKKKKKPKPAFELLIKKIDKQGGYSPGKKYLFKIRSRSQAHSMVGFMVTLESASDNCTCNGEVLTECPVGKLLSERKRIAGAAVVSPGCNQPLVMDYVASPKKKATGKWAAPKCSDAAVKFRVVVREHKEEGFFQYVDNDELPENQQFLTKIVRTVGP